MLVLFADSLYNYEIYVVLLHHEERFSFCTYCLIAELIDHVIVEATNETSGNFHEHAVPILGTCGNCNREMFFMFLIRRPLVLRFEEKTNFFCLRVGCVFQHRHETRNVFQGQL